MTLFSSPLSPKGLLQMTTPIDQIIASLSQLTQEQKRTIVERLSAESIGEISAAAAESAKKIRIGKIQAMRAERDPALRLVEGALNRAGIALEQVTDVLALDKLFAAATRPVSAEDKLMVKSAMFRMGLISA
jgi:hypothetical protein